MANVSLEHVRLTNCLRAYKRAVLGAAEEEFDRLRTEGGVDLEQAAEALSQCAAALVVAYGRDVNRERLLEYMVNGMSLDVTGLPGPIGSVHEGDRAFEGLSARIDRIAQASREAYADQPYAASLATWLDSERRRHRYGAWAITHPTCRLN